MPTAHLLAFVAASVVVVAVPGPSVLFTIGRALTAGVRVALLTVLGNGIGLAAQVLLVAAGLGGLVAASSTAYAAVKYVGAAYLIWLGLDAIRHRRDGLTEADELAPTADAGRTTGDLDALRTGVLVGVTNPKSIVFFAALLPQFVDPGAAAPQWAQLVILGMVFVLIALLGDSLWAVAAGSARGWFASSPQRLARLRGIGGLLICGLGIGVAARSAP
ncbi:MAG: LysE family translocator [Candidatus Lutibacillus vidarii]